MKTLGKIGQIQQIFPDGDLKIQIMGKNWTFNPLAVTKVPISNETIEKINASFLLGNLEEELVKAAASGDFIKCEIILKTKGSNVNSIFAGHTALQAASQNGNVNIIELLIQHGADFEIEVRS